MMCLDIFIISMLYSLDPGQNSSQLLEDIMLFSKCDFKMISVIIDSVHKKYQLLINQLWFR